MVCASFNVIVEVFPTIDPYDIKQIKLYNKSLYENFIYLAIKDDIYSGVIDKKESEK